MPRFEYSEALWKRSDVTIVLLTIFWRILEVAMQSKADVS